MRRFSFKRGLRFLEGLLGWELQRRLATGKIQFISDDGEILNLSNEELLARWQSQAWLIDEHSLAELGSAIYLVTPRDLGTYPAAQQLIAKRRIHYLNSVQPESRPYNPKAWTELIKSAADSLGDAHPPCASSVAAWWRRYRSTKDILALIPHNRASSAHHRKPGYAVFEQVLAKYLTSQKLPKSDVVDELRRAIRAINNGRPHELQMRCPARSTVYRWLDDLEQDLVDVSREGAEAARLKYRAAIDSIKVNAILERVEIDHTNLDLIVTDPTSGLTYGRPWLTVAIDRFSRLIFGFYLSLQPPSANSVLQCLKQAILPKSELLARFPDISNPWPACGIPLLIAVDNGMDLHSEAVEKAALELGIQILFCASKTPVQKGAIERFFRTLNIGLIHRIPGTTFSNPNERGDYASEDEAAIDIASLTHVITKWIVDVYNVTPHRGARGRPLDLWNESAKQKIVELPVNPQELDIVMGMAATRTLFHYGIELEGLHYNNDLVQQIRRRYGNNPKVDIRYFHDDVGYIQVLDPDAKVYLRVPAKVLEYADGLSRDIHRVIREHARQKFGEHVLSPQLLQAKQEVLELIQQTTSAKKMGHRKAAARKLQPDSDAILSGKDPLTAARRPIKQAKVLPPEDLPSGLDDELPDFGGDDRGRG
ncbi:Mu transposase C-terminal domain-containing protein [Jeongeupia naejangsanensis]|uniref:DDE-type integrase/transposase/recombinase n=1 Tax=Jeongeupia naejangsanensis TaxID=613195 RepID=A0ABS2BLC1_9NEIS|nr:Mu transposase C-terminal domain-containing protein [Jeongeupia naejangsanensis]MBM3116412.1 DDE-type integrase/transposase/recombinase [Jeongeupia naejangsanensis]